MGRKSRFKDESTLVQALDAFNDTRMIFEEAVERARSYEEKGAAWAMPTQETCERVGRGVYFLEYSFKDKVRHECVEGYRGRIVCPFSRECEHYNKDPFGRRKTGWIKLQKKEEPS